jgi:preprotein translocase subunit YajC
MDKSALATPAAPMPQEQVWMQFLPFILIFVVFYFLIIRPQQRKFKQHQAMVSAIKKGDKVVLGSGIVGKVHKTHDDGILDVEIADGVVVKVVAGTIASVETKEKPVNDNKK